MYSLWEVVRISSRAQIGPGRDESVVSDERPLAYRVRHDTLSLDRPRHHVAVVAGSESVIRRARDDDYPGPCSAGQHQIRGRLRVCVHRIQSSLRAVNARHAHLDVK